MTTILLQSNITDLCRSKGRKLHLKCVIVLVGPKCGNILILRLDHLWNKSMHIHTYTHTHKYTQTDTHARARARARARDYIFHYFFLPIVLSSRLFIVLQATDLLFVFVFILMCSFSAYYFPSPASGEINQRKLINS